MTPNLSRNLRCVLTCSASHPMCLSSLVPGVLERRELASAIEDVISSVVNACRAENQAIAAVSSEHRKMQEERPGGEGERWGHLRICFHLCSFVFICLYFCLFVLVCARLCSFVLVCARYCSFVFFCFLLRFWITSSRAMLASYSKQQ